MDIYEQIRNNNVHDYGTKVDDYIKIIINQYSDRTHFIYEIIQNAEDADASSIRFRLHKDHLEVFHDGRPFNEKDIKGICSIANGTKSGDGTQIGHFGIGFKAVFGYTNTPKVYSGDSCFEIRKYINPYPINKRNDVRSEETCFVLPFDGDNVTEDTAYLEIKEAFEKKLTAESVIMLRNIEDIYVEIVPDGTNIHISRTSSPIRDSTQVYNLTLRTESNDAITEGETDYLLFTNAKSESSTIVFKLNGEDELEPIEGNNIYAFFPTAKESHQAFLIHAPFDTTPARDNFKQGAEFGKHNIRLIKEISALIDFAFSWLRDSGYLTIRTLSELYPTYQYDFRDILHGIYTSGIGMIQSGKRLLPTNADGEFKSIQDVCIPESMSIANVFSDSDLHLLTGNAKLSWLAKEISTENYRDFRKYLTTNFSVRTYRWKDLIDSLSEKFLEGKDRDWYVALFDSISNFTRKSSRHQSNYVNVSDIPFVRTDTGRNIHPRNYAGERQVYLNNPKSARYRIDDAFLSEPVIYDFYSEVLGIEVYDVLREIRDRILPKYASENVHFETNNPMAENLEDLKKIREGIIRDPSLAVDVQSSFLLTDGEDWYRPSELHIPSEDTRCGYDLVKDIVSLRFVSESYGLSLDDDFLEKLGCTKGLSLQEKGKMEYCSVARKYVNEEQFKKVRSIVWKDFIHPEKEFLSSYEGFPEIFLRMNLDRSQKIMRFLNANAMEIELKVDLTGADNKNYTKNADTINFYTMLGLEVCFEKWVYLRDGTGPYRPVDVERSNLSGSYDSFRRILQKIPFKDNTEKIKELIDAPGMNEGQKEELAAYFANNADKLYSAMKAAQKAEAKADAKKEKQQMSMAERIAAMDRKQRGETSDTGMEINPISAKALEKRDKKLDEEFRQSMDLQTFLKRGFHFTAQSCNDEERAFLEAEYGGYCQICGQRIRRYDGKPYFEAVRIIKRSEADDRMVGTMALGWNTLCLCPNCAAKYNYSAKKMSGMYEQVMDKDIEAGSDEPISIDIEIDGKQAEIHYSPRHFMAVKKAFKLMK